MILTHLRRTLVPSRSLHTGCVLLAAQESPLFKLRQKTGLAYNLCREALNKHNNDINEAEIWLQAQALAHGIQKATKVGTRSTREGLIGLAIRHNNKLATVVEINCETDFVAKNQVFKEFAVNLTEQVAGITTRDWQTARDQPDLSEMRLDKSDLEVLDNQIAPLISRLGENIKVSRAMHFKTSKEEVQIFGQVHSQAGQRSAEALEVLTGRFGAIVALRDLNFKSRQRSLSAFGARLCKHVIGFSPTFIELPPEIKKHLEEEERSRKLEASAVDQSEEVEEEEEEECSSDSGDYSNRDEWPSIMDQHLIMSDTQTVRSFCEENQLNIDFFLRFECGLRDQT